jgi:5-methylcytosine-specific restriction enzyme subunit McrC
MTSRLTTDPESLPMNDASLAGPIELEEWCDRDVQLDPGVAEALQAASRGALDVRFRSRTNWVNLRATHLVGTVTVPGAQVLIRPKAPARNVFHLIAGAGLLPELGKDDFDYEAHDLTTAFAALYLRAQEIATGRGLHRWYRKESDALIALRGRLDFPRVARRGGLALPVDCEFEEYTADILHNRALRAATLALRRLASLPLSTQRLLGHQLRRFDEVGGAWEDPHSIDRIIFNRLDRHYEPALQLAALVLGRSGIVDMSGDRSASTFLIDMNRVFEAFVEAKLREALSPDPSVSGQFETWLDCEGKVPIKPDLVFKHGGQDVFVADAKYKLLGSEHGKQADLYQLLAYCEALGLSEGALIYCLQDGDPPPGHATVAHAGVRLWTLRVDITSDLESIDRSIGQLATFLQGRMAAPWTIGLSA